MRFSTRRHFLQGAGAAAAGFSSVGLLAQANRPITDVVVVVPGIMGSVLKRGDSTLWGLELHAFVNLLQAGNLDLANLRPDAAQPPVRATRLFETSHLIPGFWKIDGYTELRTSLVEKLGLTAQRNYFEFAYDWRLDNRIAARALLDVSRNWLGEWRESSKNADAKLILVTHSMGGLIARYATEVLGGWADTRAVFSLGTPYQGSMKSLDRIASGFVSPGLTRTLASFDSVYQLMPVYDCIEVGGAVKSVEAQQTVLRDKIDMKRYLGVGKSFYDECNAAASSNRAAASTRGFLHITQAFTHRTPISARLEGAKFVAQETVGLTRYDGDGTVPGFGYAEPRVTSATATTNYCNQLHGAIQNYEPTLDDIIGKIRGMPPLNSPRSSEAVSMKCTDFLRRGQELTVQIEFAARRRGNGKLQLRIMDANSSAVVHEVELNAESSLTFEQKFQMAAVGVYRVQLGNPIICTDLICVG